MQISAVVERRYGKQKIALVRLERPWKGGEPEGISVHTVVKCGVARTTMASF